MSLEALDDRRRLPRAPVKCHVELRHPGGLWETTTLDIGPDGCRLWGFRPMKVGTRVAVTLAHPGTPETFAARGRVARLMGGEVNAVVVAYDQRDAERAAAARWFHEVTRAEPGARELVVRKPRRISITARLELAPIPTNPPPLSAAELAILARVGEGVTVRALRAQLGLGWEANAPVLFSLVAKGFLALPGAAVHPAAAAPAARHAAPRAVARVQPARRPAAKAPDARIVAALQREYGDLPAEFAQDLVALAREHDQSQARPVPRRREEPKGLGRLFKKA